MSVVPRDEFKSLIYGPALLNVNCRLSIFATFTDDKMRTLCNTIFFASIYEQPRSTCYTFSNSRMRKIPPFFSAGENKYVSGGDGGGGGTQFLDLRHYNSNIADAAG